MGYELMEIVGYFVSMVVMLFLIIVIVLIGVRFWFCLFCLSWGYLVLLGLCSWFYILWILVSSLVCFLLVSVISGFLVVVMLYVVVNCCGVSLLVEFILYWLNGGVFCGRLGLYLLLLVYWCVICLGRFGLEL